MTAVFDLGSVIGRIDRIRRTIDALRPPAPSGDFQRRLDAAVAARSEPVADDSATTSRSAPSGAPAVRSVSYYTLGGAPVTPSAAASVFGDRWLPSEFSGDITEWADALPERGQAIAESIDAAAREAGIDPRLLAAVAWAESTFVPDAVSSAGAIGLTQLMPGTAAGLGVDPWDPEENLAGGATYLAQQIERFGSVDLGLAAYNAGPGRVIEYDGAPPYTRRYIQRVRDYYERLGGAQ